MSESNMFGLFKKKVKEEVKPLWETDWEDFIENCSQDDMHEYVQTLPTEDRKTIDYTNCMWGHTFGDFDSVREDNLVWKGNGFFSGSGLIGSRDLEAGDFVYKKLVNGGVGKYLILHHRQVKDPSDMFWAYVVCIDKRDTLEDYDED